MCGRRRQADGGNLYIARACADVWKGTRQLVYELIVLSFSLSLSLPLSLSTPRAVRFVSIPFGLAFAVPFGLAFVVPCGLAFAVTFGLHPRRSTRFSLRVPSRSDLVCAAAYFELPLKPRRESGRGESRGGEEGNPGPP